MALPSDLFTYLTSGKTVDRVIGLYWSSSCGLFLILSASALVAQFVVAAVSDDTILRAFSNAVLDLNSTEIALVIVEYMLLMFLSSRLSQMIGKAAIIQAVAEFYAGNRPSLCSSLWRCLWSSGKRICTLLSFNLLYFCIIGIPIVLLLVLLGSVSGFLSGNLYVALYFMILAAITFWVVFVHISMAAAIPIIIIEKQSVLESIQKSYRLSVGSRVYIFCSLLWLIIPTLTALYLSGAAYGNSENVLAGIFTVIGILVFLYPLHPM